MSLGVYPELTLAGARKKRNEAQQLLADDTDPGMAKQLKKRDRKLGPENCFESMVMPNMFSQASAAQIAPCPTMPHSDASVTQKMK